MKSIITYFPVTNYNMLLSNLWP